MIFDSHPWKQELLDVAKELNSLVEDSDNDRAELRLEKLVMWAAYVLRKLDDAKKLSDSTVSMQLHVERFPARGRQVDRMNWHKFEALYDLDAPQNHTLSLDQTCNYLIHSWVFCGEYGSEGGFDAFLVNSDHTRRKHLFRVPMDAFIDVLEMAGKDYPSSLSMHREASGEWVVDELSEDV